MKKIALIFWVHFAVATLSHLAGLAIACGLVALVATSVLDIWLKAMMLGLVFFVIMYCVNHITNPSGFCVLTDIENFYRRKEGITEVGPFTPRYYKQLRKMFTRKPRKGINE
jgi:hypothetical protein